MNMRMSIIPESVKQILTLDDAFIVIYVLTVIASIGWGIFFGLASKAGSIKKLFSISNNSSDNASNQTSPADNVVNE
jgi:hypothetical protein